MGTHRHSSSPALSSLGTWLLNAPRLTGPPLPSEATLQLLRPHRCTGEQEVLRIFLLAPPQGSSDWSGAEGNPTALPFADFMLQSFLWDQAETSPEISHIHASLLLLPYTVSLENLLNKPLTQGATSWSGLGSPPKAASQWLLMADKRCLG